jgi:transposase
MAGFCHRHHYNGQRTPAELLARLQAAPQPVNRIDEVALAVIVACSVAQIRVLNTQIEALEAQIAVAVDTHPRTGLLVGLPRVSTVSLALLLAEVGPILQRRQSAEQAAAMCGAAPVTRASGKTRTVGFRYAANKPARVAITGFADNSRHASTWASTRYRQARGRGARHPHAVRILARGWIRVLWICWHTDTPYDPARHHGEQLAQAAHLT